MNKLQTVTRIDKYFFGIPIVRTEVREVRIMPEGAFMPPLPPKRAKK